MTDLGAVVEQLKAERAKLDRAIAALGGVVGNSTNGARKTRTLSAAGGRNAPARPESSVGEGQGEEGGLGRETHS